MPGGPHARSVKVATGFVVLAFTSLTSASQGAPEEWWSRPGAIRETQAQGGLSDTNGATPRIADTYSYQCSSQRYVAAGVFAL